jgi:hypothetical protein
MITYYQLSDETGEQLLPSNALPWRVRFTATEKLWSHESLAVTIGKTDPGYSGRLHFLAMNGEASDSSKNLSKRKRVAA